MRQLTWPVAWVVVFHALAAPVIRQVPDWTIEPRVTAYVAWAAATLLAIVLHLGWAWARRGGTDRPWVLSFVALGTGALVAEKALRVTGATPIVVPGWMGTALQVVAVGAGGVAVTFCCRGFTRSSVAKRVEDLGSGIMAA